MPGGRPSSLTPEVAEKLLAERRKDLLCDRDVCLKCGVNDRTVRLWIRRGLQEDAIEPYMSFAEEWLRCKISRKEKLLKIVQEASEEYTGADPSFRGDYKAATWALERMAPKEWGSAAVNAGRQDGDIDIDDILQEVSEAGNTYDAVLLAPPPPLLDAIRRNRAELRALLDELDADAEAQVALPKLGG